MEFQPISRTERRSLGRFDTPRPIAQALADWAITSPTDTILEPSCGGGVIIKSAISRLVELGAAHPSKKIWACDIDPRALAETTRNIGSHKPKLVLGNFLNLAPDVFNGIKFDVIIGNPPYVRLHTMDVRSRLAARQVLPAPDMLDAKAGLWAYFPIHAFKMLSPGGRMGWILPETLLHAEYGKQILRWATQRFQRCIAVSLRERCFKGDGAKERVVLFLLTGAGGQALHGIEMIEFASANDCIAALPALADTHSPTLPQLNGHAVPHLVSDGAANAARIMETSGDLKRFGDFADVKIGVVTGDNRFFVLSQEQRASAKLNKRYFHRIISKFINLGDGFVFTGEECAGSSLDVTGKTWLLCPNPKSMDKWLTQYLETYPASSIKNNKTMAKRAYWQVPVVGSVPDAFFSCMGQYGPRLVLNRANFYCTNNVYQVFFHKNISKVTQRAICLSLHSTYSQLSAEFEGRQYGSGVLKFEPSEAKRVVFASNQPLIEALSNAWPKLKKTGAGLGWKAVVPQIDDIIVAHCPNLAKSLPLAKVRSLLIKVRERRNGIHFTTGS